MNSFDAKNIANKLGETISVKGKEVTDKARDLVEIANLKSQIKTNEDVMKRNYTEIGRLYYELHGMEPEADYEEQCRAIENAQNMITDLEEKIREIKGI
ncbi:MAG: zinc ribbon domain-containing protein [Lachnospiraceae bacterium]|nr:zinc ribbon domain-containing protein [Lachnospiraceae bacterium]